jgi:hypothetical protein
MTPEEFDAFRVLKKNYAISESCGVVAVMSDDVGGLTFVGHWIKTSTIKEIPESMSWEQLFKLNLQRKNMLDDIAITNLERDKAWASFIRNKSVKAYMKDKKDFNFPLDGSYEVWCTAWDKAWSLGFKSGYHERKESL